jgi:hypothetical protein
MLDPDFQCVNCCCEVYPEENGAVWSEQWGGPICAECNTTMAKKARCECCRKERIVVDKFRQPVPEHGIYYDFGYMCRHCLIFKLEHGEIDAFDIIPCGLCSLPLLDGNNLGNSCYCIQCLHAMADMGISVNDEWYQETLKWSEI